MLIRPLHLADKGSATLFSISTLHEHRKCSVLHNQTFCFPAHKNDVRMSKCHICFFLFVILSNDHLYTVMVHLNTALPKQSFVLQDNSMKFSPVFFFGSAYFSVHCSHTQLPIFSISKLLLLHLLHCSTRSCSWLVFTNTAGGSRSSASDPVPSEQVHRVWRNGSLILETIGTFIESKGTGEQLTIALSRGALSALHLITWKL